jgi:hypothetical protein
MNAPWTLGRTGRVVMDANGERVADCRNEDVGDEARDAANARLIAAAPELLAALKQTLDNCKFWCDDFKDAVRAAIAKAEGK